MFVFLEGNLAEVKISFIPPDFGIDFEPRVRVDGGPGDGWDVHVVLKGRELL